MIRLTALAAFGATLVTTLVLTAPVGAVTHPKLVGVVGKHDAYKISLTRNGAKVKTLKAGTYTVVIHDDSHMHNYELDGPAGKSWKFTSVNFVGAKTFTLKLTPGNYKAYCQPHEDMMFQHFSVK